MTDHPSTETPTRGTERILSFDCANKSLGYTLFDINWDAITAYYPIKGKPNADKYHKAIREDLNGLNGNIVVHHCGVVKLFDEKVKDTDIIYRVKKLKHALDQIELGDRDAISHVVIEYQYVSGSHSREVSDCLAMYWVDHDTHLFFPSARKKLHFSSDLTYDKFRTQYTKAYDANKAHSIANLKFIAVNLTLQPLIDCIAEIPASNHDDLAESFLNAYVWVLRYRTTSCNLAGVPLNAS